MYGSPEVRLPERQATALLAGWLRQDGWTVTPTVGDPWIKGDTVELPVPGDQPISGEVVLIGSRPMTVRLRLHVPYGWKQRTAAPGPPVAQPTQAQLRALLGFTVYAPATLPARFTVVDAAASLGGMTYVLWARHAREARLHEDAAPPGYAVHRHCPVFVGGSLRYQCRELGRTSAGVVVYRNDEDALAVLGSTRVVLEEPFRVPDPWQPDEVLDLFEGLRAERP